MTDTEEALFDRGPQEPKGAGEEPDLPGLIRRLVTGQQYGVLCTQGQGQPYGSLVAFAFTEDLREAVFATPITTRKYRLLKECDHVALVVDDRPDHLPNMMQVEAITVTGRAVEVPRGEAYDRWARRLVRRHPYLESFVAAASCALFRIKVFRHFHVTRFQEVREWTPTDDS
ncbi:MAG: pyridoxamine 5'-phosphate oxidase family protein [Planctomycetota bacterium]|jgi:nitroimidazol reductase NimA-like FMN-containing flavoprotein (pyridoxamine 5'-phosphate oxidase superfamily)